MRTTKIIKINERSLPILLKIKKKDESNGNNDEVVYVAMKDDFDEDEAIALVSYVNKSDKWIIDNLTVGVHIT